MDWLTSDEHLNHFSIIDHTRRPFWTWQEMNKVIIDKHNSRVQNMDTVYHLGDFKLGANGPNMYELLKMLNGRHVFLKGNHDSHNGVHTLIKYAIIQSYGLNILLTHIPDEAIMFMSGNSGIDMAFVGHVHRNWKFKKNMVNVGVDVWDFYPVGVKQILKAYKNWEMGRDEEWKV